MKWWPTRARTDVRWERTVLFDRGPRVDGSWTVHPEQAAELQRRGTKPPEVKGVFIVDTGAQLSVVGGHVIDTLGLMPLDKVPNLSTNGTTEQLVYAAVLKVGGVTFAATPVGAPSMLEQSQRMGFPDDRPFIGLIGRDVLSLCHMTYDGPAGAFTIRWRITEPPK